MALKVYNSQQTQPENIVLKSLGAMFAAICLICICWLMVDAFADISGAHCNPAATFATMITGKMGVKKSIAFIFVQLLASVLAVYTTTFAFKGVGPSGVDRWVIPAEVAITIDDGDLISRIVLECVCSFIATYIGFATAFDKATVTVHTDLDGRSAAADSNDSNVSGLTVYTTAGDSKAGFAPLAIGFATGALNMCGSTCNPGRAFGPTLVSGIGWNHHWVFWLSPLLGSTLGGLSQGFFTNNPQDDEEGLH